MIEGGKLLVDEFVELQKKKSEIEERIESIKNQLALFSKKHSMDIVYGTQMKASVKEYFKVVYPEENKPLILHLIKEKGLYEEFSSLNYFKLNPRILKNQFDNEIIKLIKKEKSYRISLRDREDIFK